MGAGTCALELDNDLTLQEKHMRRLVAILVAALFSAVTFSVFAADQSTQGTQTQPQKHAKKKKSKPAGVSQSANPMDKSGQGAAQSSGTGGVQAGAPAAQGRGTPTGAAGGGAVTSPTPKGPGRADNQ
jgi:hypothetical protein